MSTVTGSLDFSLLYSIDTIVASDFSGSGSSNSLSLSGLTQVSSTSEYDYDAVIVDDNDDGEFNAGDTLTFTFPGDTEETTLTRVDTAKYYGSDGSGFASGTDYAIFEDEDGNQYILFSSDFDISRISSRGNLTLTEGSDSDDNMDIIDIIDVICFASGTKILTPNGERAVESLKVGDTLVTQEGKTTTIHWASHTHHSAQTVSRFPNIRPIKIPANSFAAGMPHDDLYLSRQHRVMIESVVAERMVGQSQVLVPIHTLAEFDFATTVTQDQDVSYYHILTDQHDVLLANGLPCESLYVGEHLEKALDPHRAQQVRDLVESGVVSTRSSCHILENKQARNLLARIAKNAKSLLEKCSAIETPLKRVA